MNGHFPTLKPSSDSASGGVRTSRQAEGAWGGSATDEGGSGREAGVWGAKANEPLRGATVDAAGDSRPSAERDGGGATQQSGKRKGRKGKAVSLFSNAGVRGGGAR